MKSHLKNLISHTPELLNRKILDVGSGEGDFLIDVVIEGGDIYGLDRNKEYIEIALNKAEVNKVSINLVEGIAERLPFKNNEFGFLNISEVIEHVKNADLLIKEAYRVLEIGGSAYLSVPSRFSFKDPHFHLYFVNWLPQFVSDPFIFVFGKHKDYKGSAGEQKLSEMNYYKFNDIKKKLKEVGFYVIDIRERKIKNKIQNRLLRHLLLFIYKMIRPFYFDTFHLLLKK
jgi:ubiquinone/menaquinone biosynthesis C-methylase UbiE